MIQASQFLEHDLQLWELLDACWPVSTKDSEKFEIQLHGLLAYGGGAVKQRWPPKSYDLCKTNIPLSPAVFCGSDMARMWLQCGLDAFLDVASKVWQKWRERGFQRVDLVFLNSGTRGPPWSKKESIVNKWRMATGKHGCRIYRFYQGLWPTTWDRSLKKWEGLFSGSS